MTTSGIPVSAFTYSRPNFRCKPGEAIETKGGQIMCKDDEKEEFWGQQLYFIGVGVFLGGRPSFLCSSWDGGLPSLFLPSESVRFTILKAVLTLPRIHKMSSPSHTFTTTSFKTEL